MDEQEWNAKLAEVAEAAWLDTELNAKLTPDQKIRPMVKNLFIAAYMRGAKDTMLTLKAMQAMDISGKPV